MLGKDYLFMYLQNIISSLSPRILVYFFLIITTKANVLIHRMQYFFFPLLFQEFHLSLSLRHYQLVMIKTVRQIILLEMLHLDLWSHSSPCEKDFFLHCLLHKWPEFLFTQVFLCRSILIFSLSLSSLWSSCLFLQHENDRCVNWHAEKIFPF